MFGTGACDTITTAATDKNGKKGKSLYRSDPQHGHFNCGGKSIGVKERRGRGGLKRSKVEKSRFYCVILEYIYTVYILICYLVHLEYSGLLHTQYKI